MERPGYTCVLVEGASPYYIVTRADGVGIGAYPSKQAVDDAIAKDEEYLATLEAE